MEYLIIIISAIFVHNIVLNQFLGLCPFIGVSNKLETSVGMTGAVIFVMVLATTITYLIQHFILDPFHLGFLKTVSFILIIASLVQLVEIVLKKVSPPLYQALGIFLPLITTNCAIMGVALLAVQQELNLIESVLFAFANALGFGLALVLFAGIRQHLEFVKVPKDMRGVPIAFIVGGILAMAFMGFAGLI